MSIYEKRTHTDRKVQYPGRRQLVETGTSNVYDIYREEGTVNEAGTAFNAAFLNGWETRIDTAFANLITIETITSSNWVLENGVYYIDTQYSMPKGCIVQVVHTGSTMPDIVSLIAASQFSYTVKENSNHLLRIYAVPIVQNPNISNVSKLRLYMFNG